MNWRDLIERPAWMRQGACRGAVGAVDFFPARGEATMPAKRLCAECPVRAECLAFAINTGEKHGIWGGLSERERRVVRHNVRVRRAAELGRGPAGALPGEGAKPIDHGTDGGYKAHRRRDEAPCHACVDAHRRYEQANRPSRARTAS